MEDLLSIPSAQLHPPVSLASHTCHTYEPWLHPTTIFSEHWFSVSYYCDPILPHHEACYFIMWLSHPSGQDQFPGVFWSLSLAGSISSKFPSDPLGCEGFRGTTFMRSTQRQTLNWRHLLSGSAPSGSSEHHSLHNFILWPFEMSQESTLRRHCRTAISVPDPLAVCHLWAVEVWVLVPRLRGTSSSSTLEVGWYNLIHLSLSLKQYGTACPRIPHYWMVILGWTTKLF